MPNGFAAVLGAGPPKGFAGVVVGGGADAGGAMTGPRLHARSGPLTEQLLLSPGPFGLGQVPRRLLPDRTTTMVCGLCSTGCGLDVHLQGDQVVNLTPSVAYPVNLGMACPKGWEALTPLQATDRATIPASTRCM